jgi:phosphoribosylformimino-5-aminoimidazole carboxamide ribotide isomerase
VERVVLGTAAIVDPGVVRAIAERWPGRVVVAVDARGGKVATNGWLQTTSTDAVSLVKTLTELPICAVLYTDIERDGTEVGPNVAETARLARDGGLPVIASGGVGTLEHLRALRAADPGIIAAILGRALHERRFTLDDAVAAAAGQ